MFLCLCVSYWNEGCFLNLCEELSWSFDGYSIYSLAIQIVISLYWYHGHFHNINPADPQAWEIFPSFGVFFSFFLQCHEALLYKFFTCSVRIYPKIIFEIPLRGTISLIFFSAYHLYDRKGKDFCVLTLNSYTLLKYLSAMEISWLNL